jgi:hypothetical protein
MRIAAYRPTPSWTVSDGAKIFLGAASSPSPYPKETSDAPALPERTRLSLRKPPGQSESCGHSLTSRVRLSEREVT